MDFQKYQPTDEEQVQKPASPEQAITFQWGLKIPMRDGILLNATLYKPERVERVPAVFTLTPYIADSYHPRAMYFAEHGFAYLLVDCRGRGNSQGDFEPFVNEGRDGYDIVEWLAGQAWCDGSVTMWGGSYAGFNQWMTLKEFPPHLKTIVPAAAAHAGVDFPMFNNVWWSYEMQWMTFTSGVTGNSNLFGDYGFWRNIFRSYYLEGRPFIELDQVTGNLSTHFQTWLRHPRVDEYWKRMALTPAEYDHIDIPILTITGHYDGDQPGAMHYYREHMRSNSPAKDQHYLVIGPWDHAGTRTPAREVGGVTFGEACLVDLNKLHEQWYCWTMQAGEKPEFLKNRVAYYLMGAEEWKYAESLEAIASGTRRFYLNSFAGGADDVFHSGILQTILPTASQPDQFVYDPLDLRPAELEKEEIKAYLTDQRFALQPFGNGLIYHTPPFEAELEMTGYIKLVAYLSMDVPDTDFVATLSEILLDGTNIDLTQDVMRARFRESLEEEKLVVPGEINCYTFSSFTFFSRKIAKGSRLRLIFRCPNSIYIQKNYNSGGKVEEESKTDARTAHISLYHDADHPSYVEVPVVEERESAENPDGGVNHV